VRPRQSRCLVDAASSDWLSAGRASGAVPPRAGNYSAGRGTASVNWVARAILATTVCFSLCFTRAPAGARPSAPGLPARVRSAGVLLPCSHSDAGARAMRSRGPRSRSVLCVAHSWPRLRRSSCSYARGNFLASLASSFERAHCGGTVRAPLGLAPWQS
jgi:hypothetical protein